MLKSKLQLLQHWRERHPDLSGSEAMPEAGVHWGMVSPQFVAILLLSRRKPLQLISDPFSEWSFPAEVTISSQLWSKMVLLLHSAKWEIPPEMWQSALTPAKSCYLCSAPKGVSQWGVSCFFCSSPTRELSNRDSVLSGEKSSPKILPRDLFGKEESRRTVANWTGEGAYIGLPGVELFQGEDSQGGNCSDFEPLGLGQTQIGLISCSGIG